MEQRVAIVTGGLRGLGRAMALGLGREGHLVLAVGHIAGDVEAIEREMAGTPLAQRLHPLLADLRRAEECDRVVAAARTQFGEPEILVNNAGLTFTYIDPPRFRRPSIQKFWSATRSSRMSSLPITSPVTGWHAASRPAWRRAAGAASSTSRPSSTR
jgi:3-oxoacyl-[acyl-carrier protein] reductase